MHAHESLIAIVLAASTLAGATSAAPEAAPPPSAAAPTTATVPPPASPDAFGDASRGIAQQLQDSLKELDALRGQMAAEMVPLSRQLTALENQLADVRKQYQDKVRELDARTLGLGNLRGEIDAREKEATYLAGLLGEYQRNFESRLHVTELQRYRDAIATARLAAENTALSEQEIAEAQASLLAASLERLHDVAGGTRFEGTAVGEGGTVQRGRFVLVGPVAAFLPEQGPATTAEQRLGSLEPAAIAYPDPLQAQAAEALLRGGDGVLLLDPTLGNARKVAETEETLAEHIRAGGPVMIPIFILAGAALLVALAKWIGLSLVRMPSRRRVDELLKAVAAKDPAAAGKVVERMPGPVGRMLKAGVANLAEPRELIEEAMFETILSAKLRLTRFLPFIAVAAAAAPLLGLLGTVTGIITTFKLITVFGSGDVKSLSGGISEALITTEWGLIVAIPSLLIHAYLSRKARGIVDRMEGTALNFLNEVARSREPQPAAIDREALAKEVRSILSELLTPAVRQQLAGSGGAAR